MPIFGARRHPAGTKRYSRHSFETHENLSSDIASKFFNPSNLESVQASRQREVDELEASYDARQARQHEKLMSELMSLLGHHLGEPRAPSEPKQTRAQKSTERALRRPNARFL